MKGPSFFYIRDFQTTASDPTLGESGFKEEDDVGFSRSTIALSEGFLCYNGGKRYHSGEAWNLKRVRLAIAGLVVLLIICCFFYFDNRKLNQLAGDELYPMAGEPTQHPQPLTASSVDIGNTGIHVTRLYSTNASKGLFMGIWYGKGNNKMNAAENDWLMEDGEIDFLVQAVDTNGTTFNGEMNGVIRGTFSTFRYVKFDDFHYDDELESITLAFYPLMEGEEGKEPYPHAWLETSIPVE
ncbi:UNVERIFIED_CONTAM: hypothetical protein N8J90_16715 [Halobacillus marinus]